MIKNYKIEYGWSTYQKHVDLKVDSDGKSVSSKIIPTTPIVSLYNKIETYITIKGQKYLNGRMYTLNEEILDFKQSYENKYFNEISKLVESYETFKSLKDKVDLFVGIREVGYQEVVLDIMFGNRSNAGLEIFTVMDYVSITNTKVNNSPKHNQLREVVNNTPEVLGMEYLNDLNALHMITFPLNEHTSHIMEFSKDLLPNANSSPLNLKFLPLFNNNQESLLVINNRKLYRTFLLDKKYVFNINELSDYMLFSLSPLFVQLIDEGIDEIGIEFKKDSLIITENHFSTDIEISHENKLFLLQTILNIKMGDK